MRFVSCARHPAEQNLALVQHNGLLYYQATHVISEGEELRVWYGDEYSLFMGIPLGMKGGSTGKLLSCKNNAVEYTVQSLLWDNSQYILF